MTDERLLEIARDIADVSPPETRATIRSLLAEIGRLNEQLRVAALSADHASDFAGDVSADCHALAADNARLRATLAAVRAEAEAIHGKRIHRLDSYGAGLNDAAEAILALLDAP